MVEYLNCENGQMWSALCRHRSKPRMCVSKLQIPLNSTAELSLDVLPCHAVFRLAVPHWWRCLVPSPVLMCHAVPCCAESCSSMPSPVLPCCRAALSHATLCQALLSWAMLRHAVQVLCDMGVQTDEMQEPPPSPSQSQPPFQSGQESNMPKSASDLEAVVVSANS